MRQFSYILWHCIFQTDDDILVREQLEEFAAAHPRRFKLHYTIDKRADKKEGEEQDGT